MYFTLIRNILASFLTVTVAFLLICLLAMATLERAADEIESSAAVVASQAVASQGAGLTAIRQGQVALLIFGLVGFLGGVVAMVFATQQAKGVVERLRQATKALSNVVLDEMTPADLSTISDSLDREIREMMLKIKDSQKRYLDASPLTHLPGNIAIEQVLKGKMDDGEKFALCYIDLDDFKAYNDKYGYAKGSDLIKMTGEIIYHTKDEYADSSDFVGHIGGDDFVMITSPELVEQVCKAIVTEFDRLIPSYYEEDDRIRGFIEGLDRYGVKRRFPIMTISIAVVSDVRRSFRSPIEIAKVAAEIKDYVKSLPGSNYLIDRRVTTRWEP